MELYLVRHGPSESRDPVQWSDDEDRPLTRAGATETRKAARGFASLALDVRRVVSSPAVRARATAERFVEALKLTRPLEVWDELRPDSPTEPVLARASAEGRRIDGTVLVGHEPVLSELVGLALTGDALSLVHFGRAGAAALSFDRHVAPSAGRLDWLLTRSQLSALAP